MTGLQRITVTVHQIGDSVHCGTSGKAMRMTATAAIVFFGLYFHDAVGKSFSTPFRSISSATKRT
jgi:hypothetical protein